MRTTTTGATGGGQAGRFRVLPLLGFAVVLALWLAFGAVLVGNPAGLDDLWRAVGGLWLPLRVVVWLLFLPWMLGLWLWQSEWSRGLRLVGVVGLALATVVAFFPGRKE